MKKIFYVWLIPLLWLPFSILSYSHPGDEYGFYAVSSVAGIWCPIIFNLQDMHNIMVPLSVSITGSIVMAAFGLFMDQIGTRKILWTILYIALVALILSSLIMSYPSIDRALSKNGSWWAYVAFSFNVALSLSVIFSIVSKAFMVALRYCTGSNKSLDATV